MTHCIDELKRDHSTLVALIGEANRLGVTTPEGLKKLYDAKATLLAHIQREDQTLYPTLRQAAAKDPALATTLAAFDREMADASRAILAFFEKYSRGGNGLEFARDVGAVLGTLRVRIRKEESTLFPLYDKLMAKAA